MDEYSIRVNQLKEIKLKYFIRMIIILAISVLLIFSLYALASHFSDFIIFDVISSNVKNAGLKATILYFIISFFILCLIVILYSLKFNNEYKKSYLEFLISECKLDDIYILENKINNTNEINQYIQKLFAINGVKFKKAFSDASSKYSLDIDRIRYIKNNTFRIGTLFYVNFSSEKKGFLQLTKNENAPFTKYNGAQINKFGFNIKSLLKGYHMFSTYGSKSYFIEYKNFEKSFLELERFIGKKLNLVLDNDSLYILIEDYKIFFVDNIFKSINNQIFSDKMEAIRKLHVLTFGMIQVLDELFETKL